MLDARGHVAPNQSLLLCGLGVGVEADLGSGGGGGGGRGVGWKERWQRKIVEVQ